MNTTLAIAAVLLNQTAAKGLPYVPQPGDTLIKMEVEGRGPLVIKLFPKEAPKTVEQVLGLVRQGFYDGHRFFRVDRTPRPYLARFGDPQSKSLAMDHPNMGNGGSGRRVPFEDSGRKNVIGAVGLSHPPDDKDGGDSQFYIVLGPAKFLDGDYTVFGQVVSGLDLLNQINRGDRVTSIKVTSE
jgi:cyclophilin family peptidyl-prolyl cis-trans isomerase